MDMNETLGDLLRLGDDLNIALSNISYCYDNQMFDASFQFMNIFDANASFAHLVQQYYQAFPNNHPSTDSIRSLYSSTKEIIGICLLLDKRRTFGEDEIQPDDEQLKFGFTQLSDKNMIYMKNMHGLRLPQDMDDHVNNFYDQNYGTFWRPTNHYYSPWNPTYHHLPIRSDGTNVKCQPRIEGPLPERFDWRDKGVVTGVRTQGQCGSCWAFASIAALESAYLIKHNIHNRSDQLDLSEQELVSCALPMRGCQGGNSMIAYEFIKRNGLTTEQQMPYLGRSTTCYRSPRPVITIGDYCIRSRLRYGRKSRIEHLSDDEIRRALVAYGPLYIGINADRLSRNYRRGVLNDRSCSHQINHSALLVGYTKTAWVIQNSWGREWGENGYFRLKRGNNICGINTVIAYPLL